MGDPADGDAVDLYSHAGNFVARGLYNGRSKIRVRLYSWAPDVPLDDAFFRGRLDAAARLRGEVLGLDRPGRACRLVFSEGDFLSGLAIDRYADWFVVQFISGAATSIAYSHQTTGGIAFWAHVGGFVGGLALIKLMPTRPERFSYD